MAKLLMISGDTALAEGKRGAFYNTLEEFHKHWDRIDIICPRSNQKPKNQNLKFFNNVEVHPSPWPKILQSLWILKTGLKIYKAYKFDIMTVHEYPPFYNGLGARLLWRKIKIPYVLELMHIPGLPKPANLKEALYKILAGVFIGWDSARAKAVRVINRNEVPSFLRLAGVSEDKIKHIPAFYIDFNIFKPLNLEKKYDLIFVGRLEKNKGIDLLLEIAKKSNLKILIVGAGSMHDSIKSKIENCKLKIVLHGFAKDSHEIANLINQSRALIMLSYNEGGPRVILEALACGVPVVATSVGIVPEIIDGTNGKIIDWSADDAISAFNETRNLNSRIDLYKFEKSIAIKNYADKIKELI
jgi:glycosyltransferase involved in cell wall biosynthesis